MDNERPIEKLLRDYAKKRRTEAGEPREMHPPTRRLLQGEVSRQFPKPQRASSPMAQFLARWRPGLAYGVCALVVIAISVPLLLPAFRKPGTESQLAKVAPGEDLADKKLPAAAATTSTAAVAQEADEARPAGGSGRPNEAGQAALAFSDKERAKDSANGLRLEEEKQKSQPARQLTTDTPARSAPATPPPAPQIASRDRATFDAQSRMEQATRETRTDDAARLALGPRRTAAEEPAAVAGEKLGAARAAQPPKPTEPATGVAIAARSPGAAPTPSAAAPVLTDSTETAAFNARYGLAKNATPVVQRFAQTPATGNYRRSADPAGTSPVLDAFQVEQAGDQLRVIDSDGSTYSGAITPPATGGFYGTKVELKSGPVTKTDDRTAAQTISAPAGFAYEPGQNYFFRVTGTNRTLQQPLVFAGNILIPTNAPSATQTGAARSQNQFAPVQSQMPGLPNSTISGKVQLGTNRELQINAVPVNP